MSVTLLRKVRLLVGAATAKPGPAIGQALGPLGINMAEFCKQFNEKTKPMEAGTPTPVILSAFSNRTFTFEVKTPPTTWFIKKCAGLDKCSGRPGHETAGKIHVKHVYEIAKIKKQDSNLEHVELEMMCRQVIGVCASMGIDVVGDEPTPVASPAAA